MNPADMDPQDARKPYVMLLLGTALSYAAMYLIM